MAGDVYVLVLIAIDAAELSRHSSFDAAVRAAQEWADTDEAFKDWKDLCGSALQECAPVARRAWVCAHYEVAFQIEQRRRRPPSCLSNSRTRSVRAGGPAGEILPVQGERPR